MAVAAPSRSRKSTVAGSGITGKQALSRGIFQERFESLVDNIKRVIKGKDPIIRLSLTALIADGHVLFEDVPGTGKTMLCRAITQSVNAEWNRVSCTPDLLPSDITGAPVLDRKTGDFEFRPGPIFANVFLADEVNRATPKTQSALLEAMMERTVTVDGVTHPLPRPFFVLATQNPIELAGTFPLPEAQLDRFLFKLTLGYIDREAEVEVLTANKSSEAIASLTPIMDLADIIDMIEWAKDVEISEAIAHYIVDLVHATRPEHGETALQLGASSRAGLALMRTARVLAASQGREDVIPDDVKTLMPHVMSHRLILTPDAELRDESIANVIERILNRVKVPVGA